MAKKETTEKKIDARDFFEISEKKERGETLTKAEEKTLREGARQFSEAFKGSDLEGHIKNIVNSNKLEGLLKDIVDAYIKAYNSINETDFETIEEISDNMIKDFNEKHETDFVSLDEIKSYAEKNNLVEPGGYLSLVSSPGNDPDVVNMNELIEIMTTRPKAYKHVLGTITDKIFSNKLTNTKKDKVKAYPVTLYRDKRTNEKIQVYASISYDKVLEDLGENAKIPELTEDDRQVLDGIVTNLLAGNFIMTDRMIYRGFSGKEEKGNALPDGIYRMIETALDHFRGLLTLDNSPQVDALGESVSVRVTAKEQLLPFRQITTSVSINGKIVDGSNTLIIQVLDIPLILRYAQNNNEIDTRNIKLLDVPGISNNLENLRMKRYIHNQIIMRRYNFEKNVVKNHKKMKLNRKILFKSIFEYIGLSKEEIEDKSSRGRQNKSRRLKRIYKILDHYQKFGLFVSYETTHKKGTNEDDGVEISFFREIETTEKKVKGEG